MFPGESFECKSVCLYVVVAVVVIVVVDIKFRLVTNTNDVIRKDNTHHFQAIGSIMINIHHIYILIYILI